jgi:hypothetical protein
MKLHRLAPVSVLVPDNGNLIPVHWQAPDVPEDSTTDDLGDVHAYTPEPDARGLFETSTDYSGAAVGGNLQAFPRQLPNCRAR